MGRTSIPCSDETREALTEIKQDSETWNDCLIRLIEGMPAENADVAAVMERLDEFEEMLDDVETGGAGMSSGSELNAMREAIRTEVRNGMQDAMAELTH